MKLKPTNYYHQTLIKMSLLLCLFILLPVFVRVSRAHAASGPALSTTFPANSTNGLAVYLTIGEGEFNVQTAGATIIADSPGTVTVTINHGGWCNSDGLDVPGATLTTYPYKATDFVAYDIYGSSGAYGLSGPTAYLPGSNSRECSTAGTKSLSFYMGSYMPSINKYVAVIVGTISGKPANYYLSGTNGWTFENSFRFSISSSNGAAMTLTPPGITSSLYSFSNKLISTTQVLNTSFKLTTPCSMSSQTAWVDFYDVDNGQYQAGPSPYTSLLTIYAQSGPNGSAYNQVHAQGQLYGGNGQWDSWIRGYPIYIPLDAGRQYEIRVEGLTKPNSIAFDFSANVDTLFAAENCVSLPPPAAECYLTASTTSPAPGTNVEITAYVTNRSSKNWTYNSSLTDWNASNFTLGVTDYSKSYAKLSQPRVDQGDSPGGTSGPPDYNNGSFVLGSPIGTNTAPYFLPYSSYGAIVGPNGIMRFGMKQTINVGATATFTFWVKAPSTAGQSLTLGARIMDRARYVYPGYAWFNEYNPGGCTVRITASSPISASCVFSSPTIDVLSLYTPVAYVTNTSTISGTFRPSFAITGKGTYSGPNTTIGGGLSTNISSSTSLTFAYLEEKLWPVTVTIIDNSTGLAVGVGCSGSINVVRKPFFRVTNGDLMVGGVYKSSGSCPATLPSGGNVSSWAQVPPISLPTDRKGASAEHVAKIFRDATELYSASGISTTNLKWLTIANNVANPWGGQGATGSYSCMTDFYNDTKDVTTSIPSPYTPSNTEFGQREYTSAGILTLNGFTNFNGKLAIYVTGDVYIANSITMNAGPYGNVSNIPFFALIVKGNIYIAPGVTQLDGMYVAQPNGGTGGTIYTCRNADGTAIPSTSVYSTCSISNNSLTFNGIVQAKDIKLHRTFGTVGNNTPAEVFNNLLELYLAPTPLKSNISTSTQYDSATSLPPTL